VIEKYELKLLELTDKLNSYFDDQKDFIKCEPGCGICCSNGYYPLFELEYKYIKKGFELNFSKEKIKALQDKACQIYKDRYNFLKNDDNIHNFSYVCPFLENNMCSNYLHRPIICRAYGLISRDAKNPETKVHFPHCVRLGLNYSDVWSFEEKSFSEDKMKALGIKTEPKFYDVSYANLIEPFRDLDLGDVRMIFEWIIMDMPDYEAVTVKLKA